MQYSPKLKKAMEEIKKILQENYIAGFVVLHTPGFSEYLNRVDPSYSCAKLEGNELRFRVKSAEVGREKAQQMIGDTYNLMTHLSRVICKSAIDYSQAHQMLKDKVGGKDFPGTHTSHTEQNN